MWKLRRHIVILKHEKESCKKHGGLISVLCKDLGLGYKVITICGLDKKIPTCDMVILHVDLTVVPDEYIEAVASHPLVINRNVKNISKRVFSGQILTESCDYTGQVIVKTDANFGGLNEVKFQGGENAMEQPEEWESREYLDDYPVYPTLKDVPAGVWKNPRLIVEKFIPEVDENGRYLLRMWLFFGDQEIHYVNYSDEKIVKSWNKNGYKMLPNEDIPFEIRQIRTNLKMDYGKFDYVMHDGKPVLYDVNKTPGGARIKLDNPVRIRNIKTLASGIKGFFTK